MEGELTARGRGVDLLVQALEPNVTIAQVGHEGNKVLQCSPKPVQPPDNERIAGAQVLKGFLQAGTLRFGAARHIREDLLTPSLRERISLEVE
jgi:hypothetical protein